MGRQGGYVVHHQADLLDANTAPHAETRVVVVGLIMVLCYRKTRVVGVDEVEKLRLEDTSRGDNMDLKKFVNQQQVEAENSWLSDHFRT